MVIQVPIRHTELKYESQGWALLPSHGWGIFLKWPSGYRDLLAIITKSLLFYPLISNSNSPIAHPFSLKQEIILSNSLTTITAARPVNS